MAAERRSYTQNRELSWLRFNERVLLEATDESVPLLERLKFVSIFTSNLDEFFMIRVGSLHDLEMVDPDSRDNKSGMTPRQQLSAIFGAVRPLMAMRDDICARLNRALAAYDIAALTVEQLEKPELKYVKEYFQTEIDPILSPQIVDSHHPFPHLQNKVVHIGALLRDGKKELFGVMAVPASLGEVLFLPGSQVRYVQTAEIILSQVEKIFRNYVVEEKVIFCVTRNADITPGDEAFEVDDDFRAQMKKLLRTRTKLAPVRLELGSAVSGKFQQYFCQRLHLEREQVYVTASPMKMGYVFALADRLSAGVREALTYPPFTPQQPGEIARGESMLRRVSRGDVLLSYPYESMDPFLRLLREAAHDPSVVSIKITIYRLARRSKLVEYLCAAAENGKDVTVLIELRARFDEQNNIDWSQRLEEAGCRILYGFDSYKVHSKICLITRRDHSGISYITQVGTGNYNEKTAGQYTDLSYLTADRSIGADAGEFFKNMAIGNLEGSYRRLLVAPHGMKDRLMALIDREIAKGEKGYLFFKLNSVTDIDLVDKLREASRAGVEVRMIVRGICCLLPGVEGETDHIQVRSIVGRYLEHARIYLFGRGEEERMYISSADFMTRNMSHRVEVACPVLSGPARSKIQKLIEAQWSDNTKARAMQPDGSYRRLSGGRESVSSQDILMRDAVRAAPREDAPAHGGLGSRIRRLFKK